MREDLMGCISAFAVSVVAQAMFMRIALVQGVLVKGRVAIVGGMGMAAGVAVAVACFSHFFGACLPEVFLILGAALLLLVSGVLDDVKEQSVIKKLSFQVLCALIVILAGVRINAPGLGEAAEVLLTLMWLVGISNAFNMLDVMDGVAASAVIASALGLLIVLGAASSGAMILIACVVGAAAGFLVFNMPPARVYLGNAGSHFAGFLLAAVAVWGYQSRALGTWDAVTVVLVFGLPIVETLSLAAARLRKGLLPFQKSPDHLACRLAGRGFSSLQVVLLIAASALLFVAGGVLAGNTDMFWRLIVLGTAMILAVASYYI